MTGPQWIFHLNVPPEVAEHASGHSLGPCLPCLMRAKGSQVADTAALRARISNDRGAAGKPHWLPYEIKDEIREAVIVGISDLGPGLPLMPVCWDCLAYVPAESAGQQAAGLFMPNGAKRGTG
jgi:hypothetical protein